MKVAHIGIWVNDLEQMKLFYSKYFNAECGENYSNELKNFHSSFLSFESGATIELMHTTNQHLSYKSEILSIGFHHLAFSVGSKEKVDQITSTLFHDGFAILSQGRVTGDGYYESVIVDPEGNQIEITV